jgi:arginyl-tRNA synthetase
MQSLPPTLAQPFLALIGPAADPASILQSTRDAQFGDYQSNAALSQAKAARKSPRDLANSWLPQLQEGLKGVATVDIAGPGFLNLKLDNAWIAGQLANFDPEHWVHDQPHQRVVVDYSSPNVAKNMHVGHIRSTIIGDSIARLLTFRGHFVIRQNHLGDWGTQFGMLCAYMLENPSEMIGISDLYRKAYASFTTDPAFAERARNTVVKLHGGDPETRKVWERVLDRSRDHFEPLYRRLGVLLTPDDERGESFYNDQLDATVGELEQRFGQRKNGLEVKVSDGALCAFLYDDKGEPMFLNADKEALPFLIRKSDGAYLYATTDLAACRFRVEQLKADRIIVLTDARQILHFKMLIATSERAGWLSPEGRPHVGFEHVTFGTILGPDRKPFKTRDGENVPLNDLLEEGHLRCRTLVESNERGFSAEEVEEIAETISLDSIKYADLSQHRSTDYVFQWDRMLALEGNTAPYLLYAYARIQSIARKGGEAAAATAIALEHADERALALALLRFPEALEQVEQEWRLNLLTEYLYDLSGLFSRFYENCPVLKSEGAMKASRLRLCALTAATIRTGLNLLGIQVVEKM